jgi:hypothetical protein
MWYGDALLVKRVLYKKSLLSKDRINFLVYLRILMRATTIGNQNAAQVLGYSDLFKHITSFIL